MKLLSLIFLFIASTAAAALDPQEVSEDGVDSTETMAEIDLYFLQDDETEESDDTLEKRDLVSGGDPAGQLVQLTRRRCCQKFKHFFTDDVKSFFQNTMKDWIVNTWRTASSKVDF